jgi:hypothetical protein
MLRQFQTHLGLPAQTYLQYSSTPHRCSHPALIAALTALQWRPERLQCRVNGMVSDFCLLLPGSGSTSASTDLQEYTAGFIVKASQSGAILACYKARRDKRNLHPRSGPLLRNHPSIYFVRSRYTFLILGFSTSTICNI